MFLRCHEHSGAQIAAGATARHGTRGHCAHPSNFVSAVGWKSIGWSDQHAKTGRNGTLVSIRNSVRSCRSWTEDCENEIKSRVNPNTHLTSKNLDDPRCTEGRTTHVWLIFLQARLVTGEARCMLHTCVTVCYNLLMDRHVVTTTKNKCFSNNDDVGQQVKCS
jgi:hypothetical protein